MDILACRLIRDPREGGAHSCPGIRLRLGRVALGAGMSSERLRRKEHSRDSAES
jgi:hypothetical protein